MTPSSFDTPILICNQEKGERNLRLFMLLEGGIVEFSDLIEQFEVSHTWGVSGFGNSTYLHGVENGYLTKITIT